MPIIAVVGNKGGAGKTTLSINLASGLSKKGSVYLLDADLQRSSLQWHDLADVDNHGVDVVDAVEGLGTAVNHYRQASDYLVIDCPPSVQSDQTREALRHADIALIPVLPSPLDLWASVHVERLLDWARDENPAIAGLLVVNQIEPHTRLSKLVKEALAEIELPVANAAIKRRVVYRNAMLMGRSVFEMGAQGREAVSEVQQLIDEVVEKL